MKKLIFILPIFLAFGLIVPAFAAKNNEAGAQNTNTGQKVQQQTQTQQQLQISPSATGNQVQNQNQVKTKNAGEDLKIQTNTQEQETQGDDEESQTQDMPKDESPRSETAKKNMSIVSQKVMELLTTKTTQGGIDEQIKQIAQEQKQAQDQTQTELGKVDNRGGLLKSLIGPNYQALKNVKKQMEQNQLRIQQLEQLKNQLINQDSIAMVQETIQALTEQNTALQDKIALEEQSSSLLGWLFKLFAK